LEATSLDVDYFADGAHYSFSQKLGEVKGDTYKGKVVVLINEEAISQAEHLCLFFEAATDVTFVGTPTAGANGDITLMVLPGNLVVSFTGHNVRHADGRQLQRVGIQPTIKVAPTIRGLADGRDEILEAAIKYLQTAKK
jgi:C-terminal processing protease CtpA/Prc